MPRKLKAEALTKVVAVQWWIEVANRVSALLPNLALSAGRFGMENGEDASKDPSGFEKAIGAQILEVERAAALLRNAGFLEFPSNEREWESRHHNYYDFLCFVRQTFEWIVREKWKTPAVYSRVDPDGRRTEARACLPDELSFRGNLHRNEPGYSEFLELLNGMDTTRVKRCPIHSCKRLFWAKRVDQAACSSRCANLARVMRFRAQKKAIEPAETASPDLDT